MCKQLTVLPRTPRRMGGKSGVSASDSIGEGAEAVRREVREIVRHQVLRMGQDREQKKQMAATGPNVTGDQAPNKGEASLPVSPVKRICCIGLNFYGLMAGFTTVQRGSVISGIMKVPCRMTLSGLCLQGLFRPGSFSLLM